MKYLIFMAGLISGSNLAKAQDLVKFLFNCLSQILIGFESGRHPMKEFSLAIPDQFGGIKNFNIYSYPGHLS